jgi:hypothetical protein
MMQWPPVGRKNQLAALAKLVALMQREENMTEKDRTRIIAALTTMPDEAFGWFVLAAQTSAMIKGGNTQIWPDGIGGFTDESRKSITEIRAAAEEYLKP